MKSLISKFHLVLITLFALTLVTACGGGGGGTPAENNISGKVTAPSGDIASYEHKTFFARVVDFVIPSANALSGSAPVSGATVELIAVDEGGNQIGAVIATTTTAADGSFTLSTTKTLSMNLMIRVLSTTGTAAEIRAFAVSDSVDVSPASELVVAKVIDTVASINGALLAHFTAAEIDQLTALVDALSLDLSAMTIADALATIDAAAGTAFDEAVSKDIAFDYSGTWDYTTVATATSCPGNYPVGTVGNGSVVVTQNGINVTVANVNCLTCIFDGTVLDNIVTWDDTYSDPPGTTSEAGSVTIASDGLSASGSSTWTYTEAGFTCTISQTIQATKVVP